MSCRIRSPCSVQPRHVAVVMLCWHQAAGGVNQGGQLAQLEQCAVDCVIFLQEKLRLEMDDEAAIEWMQQLLNESATALMPQIMETTHKWAQYWR